jgi:AraC-like DNA-binding protein
MQSTGVSAVTAYTAHREWATRPPDERFASVSTLYEAARQRRLRSEERIIETSQFRTEAETDDDLVLCEASGRTAALTHWSFEQLAAIAGAPPKYLRTLPGSIASSAINYGLQRQRREAHQLLADRAAPWTVHAITSQRYARVHHDELASRVLDLMADHPAWDLPLGYKDGVYGAEMVPSGAYLGDRDMFLFVVDGNRDLEDPTDRSHAGLFRGFILRNSDVGAAALTLDVFLYRVICGNNVIWGFQHVAGFRRRHIGASIHEAWTDSLGSVRAALDANPADDRTMILKASTQELGATREAVLDAVGTRLELSRKQTADAYGLAEQFEDNPRSIWGYVQGLTRLSQRTPWQDQRFALDRAASRLLTSVH